MIYLTEISSDNLKVHRFKDEDALHEFMIHQHDCVDIKYLLEVGHWPKNPWSGTVWLIGFQVHMYAHDGERVELIKDHRSF